MIYEAIDASHPRIGKGYIYVQNADGPLRAVSNLEGSAIIASGAFRAQWTGKDIWTLATQVGILKYRDVPANVRMANGSPVFGPGRLTGEIIFGDETLPVR